MLLLRFAVLGLALSALGASAQEQAPGLSLRLHRRAPIPAVSAPPGEETCGLEAIRPVGFGDPSDGLALATSPTALHDAQEEHSLALGPLVELRLSPESLRLFVLGVPAQPGLVLGYRDGLLAWRQRWPFC